MLSSCTNDPINSIGDPHFTEDGINTDSLQIFTRSDTCNVNFYVEVSGSMNGFFRANKPTAFKRDVWSIFSNISGTDGEIHVFTKQGNPPSTIPMPDFRMRMNTGAFVSTASTDVPTMVQYIVANTSEYDISVLVSDMKYSPIGSKAMDVLLTQYSSEIRNTLKGKGLAWCLIAAVSDNIDKNGNVACNESPYYYWVVGNERRIVTVRNAIAIMLEREGRLYGMIDGGSFLATPPFTIKKVKNAIKLNDQAITDYETETDQCSFELNLDFSDYPWFLADSSLCTLADVMSIKSTRGASVTYGTPEYTIEDQNGRYMERLDRITIPVTVSSLLDVAEVIEVQFDMHNKYFIGEMQSFFDGAMNDNQLDKSFSVEDFIKGAMSVSPINFADEPIRILISTTKI